MACGKLISNPPITSPSPDTSGRLTTENDSSAGVRVGDPGARRPARPTLPPASAARTASRRSSRRRNGTGSDDTNTRLIAIEDDHIAARRAIFGGHDGTHRLEGLPDVVTGDVQAQARARVTATRRVACSRKSSFSQWRAETAMVTEISKRSGERDHDDQQRHLGAIAPATSQPLARSSIQRHRAHEARVPGHGNQLR